MRYVTVDDGEIETKIFHRVFESEGADWQHFDDFDRAHSAIAEGDLDSVELVLLDIQLDGDDEAGVRLAGALNKRGTTGRIVVLSGSEVRDIICRCFRAGATSYFVKPGDSEELEAIIYGLKTAGPFSRRCVSKVRQKPNGKR